MPSKPKWGSLVVGPRCDRCGDVIGGVAIPAGLKDRCVSCFMRPLVLIRIMERLKRQESKEKASC
ncbi:hypothetical protein [Singulisphaera acidiphila]|uniref:Uncharacterized protein n=1 Tax=Singulisphaera acidiphila (strain ATCC BAA-1392 / DSM 18658 / VKM B-2454 / MOB10) TaxID=886293 RepID=L0DIK9_SINAD|nr:hypothetical protein [Singulisphaera acidiphila]AGA28653.1 hypothetical protein Sinac_4464 [Singulisphaera acidiphila DSM 18658]